MIYFDNSATTLIKPQRVKDAVIDAMDYVGNAGRGVTKNSLSADRIIFEARENLCKLFNAKNSKNIVFTSGATESLNLVIRGLLTKNDHVITSMAEHNSVLRPLYLLEDEGMGLDFLELNEFGEIKLDILPKLLKDNTRAVIITHASNLTGNVTNLEKVRDFCSENNLLFIVDASQSAGNIDIDVQKLNIDALCFTGHKGLFGLQGTGGVYIKENLYITPLKVGGSGIHTFDRYHPKAMPTALEAGTQNGHGIAALAKGVEFILDTGVKNIHDKEIELASLFYENLKDVEGIKFYGNYKTKDRAPLVSFNIKDIHSGELGMDIMDEIDVAFRTGGHCAPLVHTHFHTIDQGALRFSFSYFNTKDEVIAVTDAIKNVLKNY